MLYELSFYYIVQVHERNGLIYTEGHAEGPPHDLHCHDSISMPPYAYWQITLDNIRSALRRWRKPEPKLLPPPIHFKVAPGLHDPDLHDLLHEIHDLDPVLQRNIGNIRNIKNLKQLGTAIETGNAIAVSDASIGTRNRAAHSYVIITKCSNAYIKGSAPVDCDPDDLESTRAELFGNIAIHTLLYVLSNMYSILTGEVEVCCDNKDALCVQPIRTQDISFPRYFRPNVDLKLQIQHLRHKLQKLEVLPVHIKGHQDDDDDFDIEQASLDVKCNIEADAESKLFLKTHQKSLEPLPHSQNGTGNESIYFSSQYGYPQ